MSRITPIAVPQWGLEMTEGVISQWRVSVGSPVPKGTEIVDIETAKIVNTLEASSDMPGVIRRLMAEEGDTLPVGATIAVMADPSVSDEDIDAYLAQQGLGETPAVTAGEADIVHDEDLPDEAPEVVAAALAREPAPAQRSGLSAAQQEEENRQVNASPVARRLANRLGISLASLSGSGRHGRVSVEDVQAAAGATNTPAPSLPEAPDAQQLRQINAAVFASPVARRLATREGIDLRALRGTGRHGRVSVDDVQTLIDTPPGAGQPANTVQGMVRAGPAARRMAAELGLDLTALEATGPRNTVAKADVRNAFCDSLTSLASAADVAPDYDDIRLTPMRKAIASSLVQSKQTIPHFYLTADLPLDALVALRAQMNGQPNPPRKLSLNDFLLRATALALRDVPDANVHYTEQGIRRFKAAHLSLAVAIEGGLLTPVLRNADRRGLYDLAAEASALAGQARDRTLSQAQLSGGTFTVSNLGMYGIRQFDAVINPPQGAILAVGAARREAYENAEGQVAFRSVMSVTLSCDHRVIDGAVGAQFLAALRERVAYPHGLLS